MQCYPKCCARGHLLASANNNSPHTLAHENTKHPDDRCPKLVIYISGPTLDSYEYIQVQM